VARTPAHAQPRHRPSQAHQSARRGALALAPFPTIVWPCGRRGRGAGRAPGALTLRTGPVSLLVGLPINLLLGALFAILLMGQVTLEVLNRAERRGWYLEPGALAPSGRSPGRRQ
jgi:hypothetical protein